MSKTEISTIPQEMIERKIHVIREQKVMFDSDTANFYGVETKRINEAVKRNPERFPQDFMFQLTDEEWNSLDITNCDRIHNDAVANCDRIQKQKRNDRFKPYAFTEQGVMMLASVLNSKKAIAVNIQIIRAFKKLTEQAKKHNPDTEMMLSVIGSIAQTVAMMQEQIMAITELVKIIAENQINQPESEPEEPQGFDLSNLEKLFTTKEAAKILKKSDRTIRRMCRQNKIDALLTNKKHWRIPGEVILQLSFTI